MFHNEYGPAEIYPEDMNDSPEVLSDKNQTKFYWLFGILITKERWEEIMI